MYVIIWEYEVAAGRAEAFEQAYGPDGAWAQLFARSTGYLGTELLRTPAPGGRYVTIDRWASPLAYEAFREQWRGEYAALDRQCASLTTHEHHVGDFHSLERSFPQSGAAGGTSKSTTQG
jgi:heme-degrading monooxygenase HmoA